MLHVDKSCHIYGLPAGPPLHPERARTPVKVLSGGENNRLLLAKLSTYPAKTEKVKPERKKERPRKLSFKEKRELEDLPKRIEVLVADQAALNEALADPSLYQHGDGEKITGMQERSAAIETELKAAYLRWEELEQIPE